jgi:hypothetical protein
LGGWKNEESYPTRADTGRFYALSFMWTNAPGQNNNTSRVVPAALALEAKGEAGLVQRHTRKWPNEWPQAHVVRPAPVASAIMMRWSRWACFNFNSGASVGRLCVLLRLRPPYGRWWCAFRSATCRATATVKLVLTPPPACLPAGGYVEKAVDAAATRSADQVSRRPARTGRRCAAAACMCGRLQRGTRARRSDDGRPRQNGGGRDAVACERANENLLPPVPRSYRVGGRDRAAPRGAGSGWLLLVWMSRLRPCESGPDRILPCNTVALVPARHAHVEYYYSCIVSILAVAKYSKRRHVRRRGGYGRGGR